MSGRPTLRVDDRLLGGFLLLGQVPAELRPRIVPALFEHGSRPLARAILSLSDRLEKFSPAMVAEELARNGAGVKQTLKLHELLGQGALPDEMEDLLKLLAERQARRDGAGSKAGPDSWVIHDAADHATWKAEPLEWMVRPLIPKGTVGITGGLPKIGKSLVTLDLLLHVIHRRPWLGRFEIGWSPRILYLAREDPTGRLQYRLGELEKVYGFPPLPPDRLLLLIRERFQLTDKDHVGWLHRTVRDRGIEFVVLDVLGRMARGLDPMSPKDWGTIMDALEELNRDLGVTIDILDHARKPPTAAAKVGGTSPLEVKGPIEKYGAMDFMMVLSETDRDGRLEIYCETKDSDERPHLLVDVAPRGSGKPKLTWAEDVTRLAEDRKEIGRKNRRAVLAAFTPGQRLKAGEVEKTLKAQEVELSRTTVREHLKVLAEEQPPRLIREGKGQETTYRLPQPSGEPSGTPDTVPDGERQEEQSELFADS